MLLINGQMMDPLNWLYLKKISDSPILNNCPIGTYGNTKLKSGHKGIQWLALGIAK